MPPPPPPPAPGRRLSMPAAAVGASVDLAAELAAKSAAKSDRGAALASQDAKLGAKNLRPALATGTDDVLRMMDETQFEKYWSAVRTCA